MGTMENRQREIIQQNLRKLSVDLDPKPLMSFLFKEFIITEDDIESLNLITTRKEKSEQLLLTLLRKGPTAFPTLVEGLKESGKHWLANLLLKEGKCN